jgi:hypothetical protein
MCYFVFFYVLYSIVLYCVLCTVVPLPPGTYPLAVNNNNSNNNNNNNNSNNMYVILI